MREEAATQGQRSVVEGPRGLVHWGAFREGLRGSAPLRMEVGSGSDGNNLDMHTEAWPAEGQQGAEDCSLLSAGEGTGALCHCTWG